MKRFTVPAFTALAVLWIRQLRFERRMARRQGVFERETARSVAGVIQDGAKARNCRSNTPEQIADTLAWDTAGPE